MKRFPGMCRFPVLFLSALFFLASPCALSAQTIYELRTLSDDDWLEMSTGERMRALNISNNHAENQTFLGNFGRYYDLYKKWGYDYYEMNDSYENYSFRGFERYGILEERRKKWSYSQFGDRLAKMTHFGEIWKERINDDGTSEWTGTFGYINYYLNRPGDAAWVVQESTDDWASAVIGGERIRTMFTPLTLSHPSMKGMRVDFQSANYSASIVNALLNETVSEGVSPTNPLLRGFHLRRKFGVLNIGATFVDNYYHQTQRDKGNDLRGTVDDDVATPFIYMVRVIDSSPWDNVGPRIFNVRLKVNGDYRDDIIPQVFLDDLTRERSTAIDIGKIKGTDYPIGYPKYADYLFLNDWIRGWNTKNVTNFFLLDRAHEYYSIIDPGNKPVQVNGTEYVMYWFDISTITEKVNRVEAEITVANDYRIQIAEIFTDTAERGHDAKGENLSHYDATRWRTVAESEGNVKDESNLRTVHVDFGKEVANMIYGFDAKFDYYGYKIRGEYVTNIHYYMFPADVPGTGHPIFKHGDKTAHTGHRSSLVDHAYYVTAQKNWSLFGFAGEYFKMGKFYNTRISGGGSMVVDNVTGLPWSVFPGYDLDNDGINDFDRNRNKIPDEYEPFLMFDVDPLEFSFGDDFNNNSVPDYREKDGKPDTPYDFNRKGYHFNMRYTPQENINFIIGSLRSRSVGGDNRTFNDYLRFKVDYDFFTTGALHAEYRYEKIQDNIPDSRYSRDAELRFSESINNVQWVLLEEFISVLDYRNSHVNKLFIESKIRAVPSITLENFLKYERNSQVGGYIYMYDISYQPTRILTTYAMVNKFMYTKQWGNWIFSPGIKFRFYKKAYSDYYLPEDFYTMRIPLVYLKYKISSDSNITLGMQGFDNFEYEYKDLKRSINSYRQKNYTLQFENKSVYFGYTIVGMFGFKLEQFDFDEKQREFENYKSSSFFLKMYAGFE